jgi:hypothetical protein
MKYERTQKRNNEQHAFSAKSRTYAGGKFAYRVRMFLFESNGYIPTNLYTIDLFSSIQTDFKKASIPSRLLIIGVLLGICVGISYIDTFLLEFLIYELEFGQDTSFLTRFVGILFESLLHQYYIGGWFAQITYGWTRMSLKHWSGFASIVRRQHLLEMVVSGRRAGHWIVNGLLSLLLFHSIILVWRGMVWVRNGAGLCVASKKKG